MKFMLLITTLPQTSRPLSSNVLTIIACTWYTVLSYHVLYTVLYTVLSYQSPHSLVSATIFSLEGNINILLKNKKKNQVVCGTVCRGVM